MTLTEFRSFTDALAANWRLTHASLGTCRPGIDGRNRYARPVGRTTISLW